MIGIRAFLDGAMEQPVQLGVEALLDLEATTQCFGAYTLSKFAMEVVGGREAGFGN